MLNVRSSANRPVPGTRLNSEFTKALPILILKCGQNLCDLALVQYEEVYLWFLNNKLFSVTGSKFANLCDFVAEISIAENIYHGTSTDVANLNLGNLNLGDVHIFSTGSLGKSPIHWSTPRRRRIKKINNIKQNILHTRYRSVAQPRIMNLKRHPTLNHQKKRKTAESRQPQI